MLHVGPHLGAQRLALGAGGFCWGRGELSTDSQGYYRKAGSLLRDGGTSALRPGCRSLWLADGWAQLSVSQAATGAGSSPCISFQ